LFGSSPFDIAEQLERLLPHQVSDRKADHERDLVGSRRHRQVAVDDPSRTPIPDPELPQVVDRHQHSFSIV
jgi:hypothetical protein